MNRTKRTSARVSSFFVFLRRGCGSGGTHGCRPTEDNRWARCGRAAGCGHPALRARGKGARCGRDVGDAASYAGSGGAVRGEYGLPHQCAHWFAMTFFGGAVRAGRCGHRPLRKACRAGPMCPAVEGAAYIGGGTHGCRPTEDMKVRCISMKSSFRGAKRRGNPFSPHDKKCGAGGHGLPHRRARRFAMTFFESAAGVGGSSGKSAKRRRWRKKRAGFEEVPRLAATTVDGNRLARRRAIADPYA